MFDVKTIRTVQVATIALRHPVTNEPIGASIDLAGPEHPQRKAIQMQAERRARADKARGHVEDDPEERAAEAARRLAAYTLGWSGITDNGEPVPFSEEAALRLYTDPSLSWLVDQVVEAFANRANFIESFGTR